MKEKKKTTINLAGAWSLLVNNLASGSQHLCQRGLITMGNTAVSGPSGCIQEQILKFRASVGYKKMTL